MTKFKRICKLLSILGFLCFFCTVHAIEFEFKYNTGHTYNVESTVTQEVFVNNIKSHDAIIKNYITIEELEAQADGSAKICATYETEEQSYFTDGSNYYDTQIDTHEIFRDKLGTYILDDDAFMPTVRDVPVFPGKNLKPGDTWTAEGAEVLDFRDQFNIQEPYRIPFDATYRYIGPQIINQKEFHLIEVQYDLMYKSPVEPRLEDNIPVVTMVNSSQKLYWDLEKGYLDHYTEDYNMIMETSFGDRIEFSGKSTAVTTNFKTRTKDETLTSVQNEVARLGIDNVTTHISPEGLTLSIENIQFEAESAILEPYAKHQLESLATILEQFPNDLLITGHTALAGTEMGRQILSEERAKAVANYLIQLGVKSSKDFYTQGKGANDPIADNDTPANKAKNRRVEITILD